MCHTNAVIERESRCDALAGVSGRVGLPVPALLVDSISQFGVGRKVAKQCVRKAVACAERVAGIMTEVINACVVVRAGLRLRIAFSEEAELQIVAPFGPREI